MFVFILMTRRPPRSPLFPDTTLFRSPDGPHGCSWRAAALGSPPGTARTVSRWCGPSAPRVGDGVIGSPPAFGAVQSRFESESPSTDPTDPTRRSVSVQETTAEGQAVAAVVVLAAGQGTRMRSATPKVLHTLGGRSLLGHVLAAAEPLRAAATVVVVGSGRAAVEEHLGQISPGALPV